MKFHPPGTRLGQFEVITYPVLNDTTIDYTCLDHDRSCPALLKTLRPELLQSQAACDYYAQNGAAWVELGDHPHIVRCYDVLQPDDTGASYLVLQAVISEKDRDTASLLSWLDSGQPLPMLQALLFTLQITRGMRHITDKRPGFVYGNLKPESVLVSGGRLSHMEVNRLRVTDFGLAAMLKIEGVQLPADLETAKTVIEQTQLINGVVGAPLYMAPEQWRAEVTSTATDIYALGCLLYKMLAGQHPVAGQTVEALKDAHCTGSVRPLPSDLPGSVHHLINNCLALNPGERYQSWEEVETAVAESYENKTNYPVPTIEPADSLTETERALGGWFLNEMGRAAMETGNVIAAIICFKLALKAGQGEGDRVLVGTATNNLGEAYRQLGDSREAISQHEKALIIGYEIGDRSITAFALNGKGIAYLQLGDPKSAIQYLEQALTIARRTDDKKNEMIILGNMGSVHHQLGDPRRAFQLYEQELKIARQLSNRLVEGGALSNMGAIYLDMGNNHGAIQYQEQSLAIKREVGDRPGQIASLNNLANAYRNLGHAQQAFAYYNQALEIARWMGDRRGEAFALNNMGSTYSNLGEMQRALDLHEQALAIFKEIGDKRSQGDCLTNLGFIYMRRHDIKRATETCNQAIAIDREIGDRMGLALDSFNMANLLAQQGLFSDALSYAREAATILDKVGHAEKAAEAHQMVAALRAEINRRRR